MDEKYIQNLIQASKQAGIEPIINAAYSEAHNEMCKIQMLIEAVDKAGSLDQQILAVQKLISLYDNAITKFVRRIGFSPKFDETVYSEDYSDDELQKEYDKYADSDIGRKYQSLEQVGERVKRLEVQLLAKKTFLKECETPNRNAKTITFRDYLIAQDIDGLLDEIRLLAGSEKGVRIAEIIIALRKLELIQPFGVRNHLYKAIEEFLGYNIGTKSALNPILNDYENNTLDDKRKGFIEQMESRLLRYKKV